MIRFMVPTSRTHLGAIDHSYRNTCSRRYEIENTPYFGKTLGNNNHPYPPYNISSPSINKCNKGTLYMQNISGRKNHHNTLGAYGKLNPLK
jgi:hypothetical protein